jgi:hypothetical protein
MHGPQHLASRPHNVLVHRLFRIICAKKPGLQLVTLHKED